MPKKPALNAAQKARAVELYQSKKVTQKQIAAFFGVSERTINRALAEAGLVNTMNHLTERERDILALVRRHNLTAEEVETRLTSTPLTSSNVVEAVSRLPPSELGHFLMNTVKVRLIREQRELEAQKARARAQNGEMQQEPLYG